MRLLRNAVLGVLLAVLVVVGVTERVAVFVFGWAGGPEPAGVVGQPKTFGVPGPYPVGLSELALGPEPMVRAVFWYPARVSSPVRESTTYAYGMNVFGGNGSVALAAYRGAAARNAPADLGDGPYPLVVLSPGFAMIPTAYGWLAEQLASYGLAVIAVDHGEELDPGLLWQATVDRPREIRSLIARLDEAAGGAGLTGLVDPTRSAVIGHSYGGYAALATAGARLDSTRMVAICDEARRSDDPVAFQCDALIPHLDSMAAAAGLDQPPQGLWPSWGDARVVAAVALAGDAVMFGESGLTEIEVPVMTIGGTADVDAPYRWGTHLAYDSAASPRKVEIGLEGATHMIFTGPCEVSRRLLTLVPEPFCGDPAWDKAQAHDLVRHFTTAFLLAELKNDRAAADALAQGIASASEVRYAATGY